MSSVTGSTDAPAMSPGPTGSTATATSTSPNRQQTIEQVDLGSLSYTVGDTGRVTLVNGKNIDQYGRITTLANTVYSDADGDGFPDAAVEIAVTDGNGYEALWYIVLWDKTTRQAVQLDDPFARTFRCGDVVDTVRPAPRGFTVSEHRTEGALATCADQPPDAITRTVGVRDGWLAELAPDKGYGGICPHAIGTDGNHAPPPDLRIAPDENSPRIGDTANGAWLLLPPTNSKYADNQEWKLMGYSTTGTTETWYSACAWMRD